MIETIQTTLDLQYRKDNKFYTQMTIPQFVLDLKLHKDHRLHSPLTDSRKVQDLQPPTDDMLRTVMKNLGTVPSRDLDRSSQVSVCDNTVNCHGLKFALILCA